MADEKQELSYEGLTEARLKRIEDELSNEKKKSKELESENKKLWKKIEAEPETTLGRKPSPSSILAQEVTTFSSMRIGSNKVEYGEMHNKEFDIHGIFTFDESVFGSISFAEAVSNWYVQKYKHFLDNAEVEKMLATFRNMMRPPALPLQVAIRTAHIQENGQRVTYTDRNSPLTKEKEINELNRLTRFARTTAEGTTFQATSGDVHFEPPVDRTELPLLSEEEMRITFHDLECPQTLTERQFQVLFLAVLNTHIGAGTRINVIIHGASRSGKTVLVGLYHNAVDPRPKPMDGGEMPTVVEDVLVAARTVSLVSFDNLKREIIPYNITALLCKLVTGASLVKRARHRDKIVNVLSSTNATIFAGVNISMLEEEIMNRSIVLKLPEPNYEKKGPTDEELVAWIQSVQPQWFSALLNASAGAMRHIDEVKERGSAYLSDFTRWSIAAGIELGWSAEYVQGLIAEYGAWRVDNMQLPPLLDLVVKVLDDEESGIYEAYTTQLWLELKTRAIGMKLQGLTLPSRPEHLTTYLYESRAELIKHKIYVHDTVHDRYGWKICIERVLHPNERIARQFGNLNRSSG